MWKAIINSLGILGMAWAISGCGLISGLINDDPYDPRPFHGIDPAIAPYADEFYNTLGWGKNTAIGFGSLQAPAVGKCYWQESYGERYQWIVIDYEWFNKVNDYYKRILVLHELGHCELRRGHNDNRFTAGCPLSIMHSNVLPYSCYLATPDYYMEEFYGSNL